MSVEKYLYKGRTIEIFLFAEVGPDFYSVEIDGLIYSEFNSEIFGVSKAKAENFIDGME